MLLKQSEAGGHPSKQGGQAGRQARQAGRQAGRQKKDTQTPTHPYAPYTRKPIGIPTRTPELVVSNFDIRNNSLKLKFLTRRRKRHGMRKTNSALKEADQPREQRSTTDNELHNLIRGTSADTRRHQRVRMHQELPDHCPTWRRRRERAFVRNFWTDCFT